MTEKHCERCGQSFPCGGYGCWCTDVPVTERQYDRIAARYRDCLCPLCLQQVLSDDFSSQSSNLGQV
ncbi:MAG: hypothetical protein EPO02_11345 [Nitrospirae bacterium]|nr:MAG: hypothetical protein EPO02_11345 [Nitrospirota bacterium]